MDGHRTLRISSCRHLPSSRRAAASLSLCLCTHDSCPLRACNSPAPVALHAPRPLGHCLAASKLAGARLDAGAWRDASFAANAFSTWRKEGRSTNKHARNKLRRMDPLGAPFACNLRHTRTPSGENYLAFLQQRDICGGAYGEPNLVILLLTISTPTLAQHALLLPPYRLVAGHISQPAEQTRAGQFGRTNCATRSRLT